MLQRKSSLPHGIPRRSPQRRRALGGLLAASLGALALSGGAALGFAALGQGPHQTPRVFAGSRPGSSAPSGVAGSQVALPAQAQRRAGAADSPVASGGSPLRLSQWAAAGGGGLAGVVGILYLTGLVEHVMEGAGDYLAGSSPVGAGLLGLAVGALHTFAGPDHLAGLAPLVVGQRRSPLAAFGLGALWGSGHAAGQLIVGLGCLAVHVGLVRLQWSSMLGQVSGVLVGLSLMAIGVLGFTEARDYEEGDVGEARRDRFGWATFVTGVLHGLSLDAIIFVAPALALPRLAAALHVLGVVGGTLLSMGVYTALLSAVARRLPRPKLISAGASSIAVFLGAAILAASLGVTTSFLPGL